MSGTTDVHTVVVLQGFGQGTSTATVLTNRAETMTIVDRHSDIYGEKHTLMSSKRGARPMHRTTLDLRLGNDSELQAGQGVLRSIASMVCVCVCVCDFEECTLRIIAVIARVVELQRQQRS